LAKYVDPGDHQHGAGCRRHSDLQTIRFSLKDHNTR
jgi:hypothetical protein